MAAGRKALSWWLFTQETAMRLGHFAPLCPTAQLVQWGFRAALCCTVIACAPRKSGQRVLPAASPVLEHLSSGTTALLQAVSAPSEQVVWVSGHAAVVLRSTDGGATWTSIAVPGAAADSLQFRDVYAVDD